MFVLIVFVVVVVTILKSVRFLATRPVMGVFIVSYWLPDIKLVIVMISAWLYVGGEKRELMENFRFDSGGI